MKNFTPGLKIFLFGLVCVLCWGFIPWGGIEENTSFIQNTLTKYYDKETDANLLKRYELNVTNTGFCRYKKFYSSGKIEYFAFNVSRFKDLDYYGSLSSGRLILRTQNDDVIVQTFNDKKGDVDSISTFMVIPLKGVEVDALNLLDDNFKQLKKLLEEKKSL